MTLCALFEISSHFCQPYYVSKLITFEHAKVIFKLILAIEEFPYILSFTLRLLLLHLLILILIWFLILLFVILLDFFINYHQTSQFWVDNNTKLLNHSF